MKQEGNSVETTYPADSQRLGAVSLVVLGLSASATSVWAQDRTRAGREDVARVVVIAEATAAEAEARAAAAEARAAEAELRAAQAEVRAAEAELRAARAEARLAALGAADTNAAAGERDRTGTATGINLDSRTDAEWQRAMGSATDYRRPDRTSEDNLRDGSHYEQSSDDRSYRERCNGTLEMPVITGFKFDIRSDTKSIHWRWKETTSGQWRAFFNDVWVGPVGENIVRVADTVASWHEYRPPPDTGESEFVILVECTSSGWDEIDLHYHHQDS
ncbi:MAG: hypothetical protein OXF27_02385 [Acidobacteria bacterium]|nr:hypothetical protein [Acidobacteriota bacterium]